MHVMKTEILAGLFHCLKLPNKERHQSCPATSRCKYKNGLPLIVNHFFYIVNHFFVMNSRLSSGFENVRIVLERLWQGFDQGFDRIWTSYGR